MKKTSVRIISFVIAAVLVLTLFYSVAVMVAYAATELIPTIYSDVVLKDSSSMVLGRASERAFTVEFNFRLPKNDIKELDSKFDFVNFSIPIDSSFGLGDVSSEFTFTKETNLDGEYTGICRATLTNIKYNGGPDRIIKIVVYAKEKNDDGSRDTIKFSIQVPTKYIRGPSSSSSDEEKEEPPKSDIQVDTVVIKNAAGQQLEAVDKDTPPFSAEITYYEIGLAEVGRYILEDARLSAFITSADGFKILGGTSGEVKLISTTGKYPKYRVTFKNLQCDGTTNKLGFRVQYDIAEYSSSIKGEGTAVLHQVAKKEDEEAESTLKPNVIVSEYSYGKGSIIAGEEFNLNMSFRNTSGTAGVENVVMTIEPANGFVITSASNTAYFSAMAPGETQNFSVTMRANPAASSTVAGTTPTDYSVQVKFSYQYLSKKEYASGDSTVKISIPVTQLDRFGVDEITDYSQYVTVGEEGYVTVPITNKGKSSTYNITGEIKSGSGADFVAAPVHFGNLDAGKSGAIDISISISTPGVFEGRAVITYEDENMNQKELSVPFSIMVMEPPPPPMETPPDMQAVTPEGPGLPSIIFCAAGALMMAVPLSLYIIKRVKAKGIEAADEDF